MDRVGRRFETNHGPLDTRVRALRETDGFPGAEVAVEAEAPARCDRCGGPWRRVSLGLACATCPRQVYCAAALAVALHRPREAYEVV